MSGNTIVLPNGITIESSESLNETQKANAFRLISRDDSLAMIQAVSDVSRAGFDIERIRIRFRGHNTTSTNGVPAPDPDGGHLSIHLFYVKPNPTDPPGRLAMHLYYTHEEDEEELPADATPRFAR